VADSIYAGLDVSEEIRAVDAQHLGDTVLVHGAHSLAAFAVCHYGPRSETGAGRMLRQVRCYAQRAIR
jgi:hypothetical protein